MRLDRHNRQLRLLTATKKFSGKTRGVNDVHSTNLTISIGKISRISIPGSTPDETQTLRRRRHHWHSRPTSTARIRPIWFANRVSPGTAFTVVKAVYELCIARHIDHGQVLFHSRANLAPPSAVTCTSSLFEVLCHSACEAARDHY